MKLYHVSTHVYDDKIKLFVPYVPESAANFEDRVTKRISLSTDVEHCIQAISAVDILHRNAVIRCYEYDASPSEAEDFLPPYYLWKSGKVIDAAFNQEVWCLKEITMKSSLYVIEDFDIARVIDWHAVDLIALKSLIRSRYGLSAQGDTCHKLFTQVSRELDRQGRYDEYNDLEDAICTAFPCKQYAVQQVGLSPLSESYLDELIFKDGMYYLRR